MHASPGDLCTDACVHTCSGCEAGQPCVDLFEHPIAGLVACTRKENQ